MDECSNDSGRIRLIRCLVLKSVSMFSAKATYPSWYVELDLEIMPFIFIIIFDLEVSLMINAKVTLFVGQSAAFVILDVVQPWDKS